MGKQVVREKLEALRTYAAAAAITLLCGGLVAGVIFGNAPLRTRAAAVLDVGEVRIEMVWPRARGGEGKGTWMPVASRETLVALAREAAGSSTDVLEAGQLSRISAALEKCGWFARPPLISRRPGGVIRVDGEWRIPAASVRHGGQTYMISWDGRPMPTGVETGVWIYDPAVGPPRDGAGERDFTRAWGGEDVAASLELLKEVVSQPWAVQVQGVDASQYARSGSLVIITDNNTKVVWGGRPSKPAMGEVGTGQKLAHLRQLVKETKRIDANYPMIYINQERMQFDISATATAIRLPEDGAEGER